jgi:hypothetical protein
MRAWWVVPVALVVACAKTPKDVTPIEGWHQEEGWAGECFYPKNFGELGPGDSKIARQTSLQEMMKQWTGQRDDGVKFDEILTTNVETILLGEPERIETLVVGNLEQCIAMRNGGSASAWSSWLSSQANSMTKGQCKYPPLRYTLFDYLNIGSQWHIPTGTESDFYRISEDGPWITVEGDPSIPAVGADWPCNIEGCVAGQLVMRFTGDETGMVTVLPVGAEREWTAPEHGIIEVMINDYTFYDNVYKIEAGIEHHAAITYAPVNP